MSPYRSPEENRALLYLIALLFMLGLVAIGISVFIVPGMMESINGVTDGA